MNYEEAMVRAAAGAAVKVGIVTAAGDLWVPLRDLVVAQWILDPEPAESPEVKYLGELLRLEKRRTERLESELREARSRPKAPACCSCCKCASCQQVRMSQALGSGQCHG